MHDPMTVAFEIKSPIKRRGYRAALVTIWHVDPEKDGSDDSCGWFMRSRHGNQEVLDRIASAFEFEWDHGVPEGWFSIDGKPNYSTQAIVLGMFRIAANQVFGHWSRRADRFLNRHLFDILHFAENSCDSMFSFVHQPYGRDPKETFKDRAREAAAIIYPWILRTDRPWYRHPRWHVWHWKIQINPLLDLKRWLFSRCCKCGRGFRFGESPVSNGWYGTGPLWFRSEGGIFHSSCSGASVIGQSGAK